MKSLIHVVSTEGIIENPMVKVYTDGAVSVRLATRDVSKVIALLKCATGVMALFQILSSLSSSVLSNMTLILPYLPYARQDRNTETGELFSLKTFCNIINSYNVGTVKIIDPHSDVSAGLLNNCQVVTVQSILAQTFPKLGLEFDCLVSPDAGAYKKTCLVSDLYNLPVVVALKSRDLSTGEISGTRITDNVQGKKCLIVDDICDGGRTFISLAKALKASGASYVALYVTHGIFSYGLEPLKTDLDAVYTLNSWLNTVDPFVNIASKFRENFL